MKKILFSLLILSISISAFGAEAYIPTLNPLHVKTGVSLVPGLTSTDDIDAATSSVNAFDIELGNDITFGTGITFTFDDEYSTGETIGVNKFFNVVLGIVPVNEVDSKIIALVQKRGKPRLNNYYLGVAFPLYPPERISPSLNYLYIMPILISGTKVPHYVRVRTTPTPNSITTKIDNVLYQLY